MKPRTSPARGDTPPLVPALCVAPRRGSLTGQQVPASNDAGFCLSDALTGSTQPLLSIHRVRSALSCRVSPAFPRRIEDSRARHAADLSKLGNGEMAGSSVATVIASFTRLDRCCIGQAYKAWPNSAQSHVNVATDMRPQARSQAFSLGSAQRKTGLRPLLVP